MAATSVVIIKFYTNVKNYYFSKFRRTFAIKIFFLNFVKFNEKKRAKRHLEKCSEEAKRIQHVCKMYSN